MNDDSRHPASGRVSSPWREPIVWLMLALVGASMAGSFALLRIAAQDGPIDAVPDEVQRTGQAQLTDLAPDAHAAALGLAAILRVDGAGGFIEVLPVSGRFDHAASLQLHLHHPLRASADHSVVLQPMQEGWRAAVSLSPEHDWLLQLAPTDAAWRLRGRLPKGQLAVRLAPSIEVDGASAAP